MNDFEVSTNTPQSPPKATHGLRRLPPRSSIRWISAAGLLCTVTGLSAGLVASPAATAATVAAAGGTGGGSGGGAPNARSAPAPGGAAGTVDTVSASGFSFTTSAGQKVAADMKSTTKYEKGTKTASTKSVTKGRSVLVLGTVNSTTIEAAQVTVDYKAASSPASTKVVPFTRGTTSASKQVGHIPANWSQGSGKIVAGTAADKATEAALAAYPGAIVDRVVKLSNGEYNVHFIGVNWPHHVFLSASFEVVGAL